MKPDCQELRLTPVGKGCYAKRKLLKAGDCDDCPDYEPWPSDDLNDIEPKDLDTDDNDNADSMEDLGHLYEFRDKVEEARVLVEPLREMINYFIGAMIEKVKHASDFAAECAEKPPADVKQCMRNVAFIIRLAQQLAQHSVSLAQDAADWLGVILEDLEEQSDDISSVGD